MANQVLFTPNGASYDINFTHPDRHLVLVPTLKYQTTNPPPFSKDPSRSVLVKDDEAPFPYVPCMYSPPRHPDCNAVVVHFHGTGGDAERSGKIWFRDARATPLHQQQQDFAVLSVEYPGYGVFPGRASERRLQQAAVYVLRFLIGRCSVLPEHIIVSGRSMGSGVASYCASVVTKRMLHGFQGTHDDEKPLPFGGVVLISPFTSIHAVLRNFPLGFLLRVVIRDRFPNEARARRFSPATKLFVLHGVRDPLIPYHESEVLARVASCGSKELILDPDGNHHHIPLIGDFLSSVAMKCSFLSPSSQRVPVRAQEILMSLVSSPVQLEELRSADRRRRARWLNVLRLAVIATATLGHWGANSSAPLLATSALWAVVATVVATLHKSRHLVNGQPQGGKIMGLGAKQRVALVTILCKFLFPAVCWKLGGRMSVVCGLVASQVLHA